MALIPLSEWAKNHGRALRSVQDLVTRGRLPEAQRVGRNYIIEEDIPYPEDLRTRENQKAAKESIK